MSSNQKWKRKVAAVFDTRPRISSKKDTIWLDRSAEMKELDSAASRLGAHVCLDGPTGAGKTSLGLSYLVSNSIRHIEVQVTAELDWKGFCRQLVVPSPAFENSITGEMEVGVDHGLPVAKLKVVLGDRGKNDQIELAELEAQSWTEHDVARRLAKRNAMLFVDDVERASDSLLRRIADLSRLLSQSYTADNAKLFLLGSGDVYQRLYRENPALEERLLQVSLGGFAQLSSGTSLMVRGFNALGIFHPWNSRFESERHQRKMCQRAIWDAADGLPKSVNSLAYSIAVEAGHNRSVTAASILSKSAEMTEQHWVQYAQRFPDVVAYLYENALCRDVVGHLYRHGIARIHRLPNIFHSLSIANSAAREGDLERAVDGLVRIDFLVRTGRAGELVFVKHPTAAHALGVAMRDPDRFQRIAQLQLGRQPLARHFPLPDEGPDDLQASPYLLDGSPD